MITQERYGVREDGRPVTEVSTYMPVEEDHPLAVQISGAPGFWARVAVGNSLTAMGATPVSRQEFLDAVDEARLRHEAVLQDLEDRRERLQQELDAKRTLIQGELTNLGLSTEAINAILQQVKG